MLPFDVGGACRAVTGCRPPTGAAARQRRPSAAHGVGSAFGGEREGRALEHLARSLEDDHPGAEASIREGLHETLTVLRLGLTGPLQHDEHHREPQRRGGALHTQREELARRSDDPALGGESCSMLLNCSARTAVYA